MRLKVDKEIMRQSNVLLVFESIYRRVKTTKAQLSAETGMSAMAMGRIADFLLEKKLITEAMLDSDGVGRPAKSLGVNMNILSVGISLKPGGVLIGVIDPYGKTLYGKSHAFAPESMPPKEALAITAEITGRFMEDHKLEQPPSIGLAVPGLIDINGRLVRYSYPLKWENVSAAEILESMLGTRVILENDIKAHAYAENRLGQNNGGGNIVLINIGSGVGAGIVVDGEVFRGRENMAGEIGHVSLSPDGRICSCGRRGCIEATVSLPAVLSEARRIKQGADIPELEAEYKNGELWAKSILDDTAAQIFLIINLMANAYAPDSLVLCGDLIDSCGVLREIIMRSYMERNLEMYNNDFKLEFSVLGTNGAAAGAAAGAFNENVRVMVGVAGGG